MIEILGKTYTKRYNKIQKYTKIWKCFPKLQWRGPGGRQLPRARALRTLSSFGLGGILDFSFGGPTENDHETEFEFDSGLFLGTFYTTVRA